MKHPPQESDLVPGRAILGIGIGVVVATVVGALVAYSIGSCRARALGAEAYLPASPKIEGDVGALRTRPFTVEAQGLDNHAREEARLRSYGWADQARRIIHIPIDTAAGLYLERRARRGRP